MRLMQERNTGKIDQEILTDLRVKNSFLDIRILLQFIYSALGQRLTPNVAMEPTVLLVTR